ncbi:hypothetical protein GCM10023115_07300 [Pontixanthobacter gangjinensis]|uniref:Uncharacterized protein n=1 Tax=Pontixanthobacter gangjinensis TaxID=1028742 RepID=A0A6I4SMC5_9SPHN|nr:hypothetical protein [Pontixanthobacter gangjinensis]MXO55977.1 hypothetical protein [Pontixanthobacter gangjinensis]
MRKLAHLVALAGLVSAANVTPSFAEEADSEVLTKSEAELAKILEGRVAGEPVKCLTNSQRRNLRIIDETAMVFRAGRTIYVNRTSAPRFLNDWDYPVFTVFGSSLCRMDRVEMRNRSSNFPGPVLTLGEFVPYTKIEAGSESYEPPLKEEFPQ